MSDFFEMAQMVAAMKPDEAERFGRIMHRLHESLEPRKPEPVNDNPPKEG